jgi:DNA-binding response OmpR family regulator
MNASNNPNPKRPDLTGCRVLLVEDEYYIADDLRNALEACGAEIVGPIPSLVEALPLAESESLLCAVLDINLRGKSSFELAEALSRRNVPFIYSTGYPKSTVPESLKGTAHLEKPFRVEELLNAVEAILHRQDHAPNRRPS